MTNPDDVAGEGSGSRVGERQNATVQPLERTAPVYVESTGDYVDIRQPSGDPTLYTPEEAREIAQDILTAAEASEHGTAVEADRGDGQEDEQEGEQEDGRADERA